MLTRELTVDVRSRWDAVDLLRRLQALRTARTYMVQGAYDRWTVYAQPTVRNADGTEIPEVAHELLASVERWKADRSLAWYELRLDGEVQRLAGDRAVGF